MLARNVAGGTQGGRASGNVSLEQVLAVESRSDWLTAIDQEFAATVRNDPSWASVKAVRDNRVHLSPKMPFGWVDFPPSVNFGMMGLLVAGSGFFIRRAFPEDLRTPTRIFIRCFIT